MGDFEPVRERVGEFSRRGMWYRGWGEGARARVGEEGTCLSRIVLVCLRGFGLGVFSTVMSDI